MAHYNGVPWGERDRGNLQWHQKVGRSPQLVRSLDLGILEIYRCNLAGVNGRAEVVTFGTVLWERGVLLTRTFRCAVRMGEAKTA